jgi:ribonuclease P protein component
MKAMRHTFKRCARLSLKRDFRRVYAAGLTYRGRFLYFFSCPGRLPYHRIGIVISRATEPLSSRRNYLRRVIREVYRRDANQLTANCDIIFKLRRRPDKCCYQLIKQDFFNFCKKVNQKCSGAD